MMSGHAHTIAEAMMVPDVMNAQGLATHLGVTERTVRRWIASGALVAQRRGRAYAIRREDGERVRDALVVGTQSDRAQLEQQKMNLELELAELRGRYRELQALAVRFESEKEEALRRALRAEAQLETVSRRAA